MSTLLFGPYDVIDKSHGLGAESGYFRAKMMPTRYLAFASLNHDLTSYLHEFHANL